MAAGEDERPECTRVPDGAGHAHRRQVQHAAAAVAKHDADDPLRRDRVGVRRRGWKVLKLRSRT
jgi:hypothetical protein